MNLGEMYEEIRDRLGEDTENFWADTAVYRALNDAIIQFNHEARWQWLVTKSTFDVASGDTEIELVDDVDLKRHYGLILVPAVDTNDRNLRAPERVPPERMAELRQGFAGITGAKPRYFYLDHRAINDYDGVTGYGEDSDNERAITAVITIIPAADQAYTGEFRFYRNTRMLYPPAHADYAAAGSNEQEPDVPMQYQSAVVCLATGNLWLKELNGGTKAQEQFNVYNSILDRAKKEQASNADDEYIVWGGEVPRTRRANAGGGIFGPNGFGYLGSPEGELPNT